MLPSAISWITALKMHMLKSLLKSQPKLFLLARSIKQRIQGLPEPEPELHLLPMLVDPTRVAVDVGANNGLYSVVLGNIATHVVAIEAIPELANGLRRLLPNIEVIHAAASDQPGRITLAIPEGMLGLSSVAHTDFNEGRAVRKVDVNAVTLDGVFENRADSIGFIKIDVEGHELAVLQGASRVIKEHRPVLLIEAEERHCAGTVSALFDYFSKLGYSGFFMDGVLRGLAGFDPTIHQSLKGVDLAGLDRGEYSGRYVNNFIFIP